MRLKQTLSLNGRTRFRSHDSGVEIAISDVTVDLRETSNEPSNNSVAFAPASHSTSENSVGETPQLRRHRFPRGALLPIMYNFLLMVFKVASVGVKM